MGVLFKGECGVMTKFRYCNNFKIGEKDMNLDKMFSGLKKDGEIKKAFLHMVTRDGCLLHPIILITPSFLGLLMAVILFLSAPAAMAQKAYVENELSSDSDHLRTKCKSQHSSRGMGLQKSNPFRIFGLFTIVLHPARPRTR